MKTASEKKYNPIWFSIAVNAGALLISLFLFRPFFEEIDDAQLAMIAEGAFGFREVHLIYTNIILGYVYRGLYALCPVIRWHSVLQYAFTFIAFTAFTYVVQLVSIKKDRLRSGRLLSLIFLITVSYESYVSLQYSKTATSIAIIGYLLLLYVLKERVINEGKETDRTETGILAVIAYILVIYAMLLRDSSFMLASLLIIPILLYEFILSFKEKKGRVILRYIYTFAPAVIFLVIFTVVNKRAYDADPSWKAFMEYNDTRMQLLDYRYDLMDYNSYRERLGEMDISENDALMYLTWQFGDDSVLTTGKMQEILNGAPARWTVFTCLKALVAHLYEDVLLFDPLLVGLMLTVIYLLSVFAKNRDRGGLFLVSAWLIEFSAILVYYEYCGRWSHRIVFAAMLALMIQLIYIAASGVYNDTADMNVAAVFIAIACLTVLAGNRLEYNRYLRNGDDHRTFLDSLKDDKDTLYVTDTFTFQNAFKYDVFRAYRVGSLDNYASVGSWFVNSPITKQVTEKYGYENPFAALAGVSGASGNKGKVILADNMYLDEKLLYLKEHYGEYGADEKGNDPDISLYGIEKK